MKKAFVLDTNVVLHDPTATQRFADEEVVVPIYAIEEIDRFKRELSERGRNARTFSRYLDRLRSNGNLAGGVPTGTGGRLRVASVGGTLRTRVHDPSYEADDLILSVALEEKKRRPDWSVIFVTRDVNLRIRADAMGLEAVDYIDERVDLAELYGGVSEKTVPADQIDKLYADGAVDWADADGLRPNEYLVLKNETNPTHTGIARFDEAKGQLVSVRRLKDGAWGIRPRNKEQHFTLDLLLNDDIQLVTLVGMAGTGKTLLAIAAGLHKVVEERKHKKLLVSRPIFPLGRDIGFLPGDLEEKLNPWMQPIFDNLELLLGTHKTDRGERETRSYEEFLDLGYVAIEPLTYIRGRSIPNQFMIVDEAQNLTPHEIKTILTRVGENTKIILTGDPYQIDNPYVDSSNNGLSTVVERFKDQRMAGHITLVKGERSALAELAANIL